eukprot:GHVL01039856.1.p1 GENE.GHVL01039856.1~~GHVL01039856.1.p1  ORF type:complete len:645 (+),score=111.73 GHVL01039856.1:47-1981(+)
MREEIASVLYCITFICIRTFLICFYPIIMILTYFTDRILTYLVDSCYIYNVSWEDPRIDLNVMNLKTSDKIITICSAGDNVLDYAIEGAAVVAVDLNQRQLALAEFKFACIRYLSWEDTFEIFGYNNMHLLREVYGTSIRPNLSREAQQFWDVHAYKLKNFQYSGSSGWMAYFLFQWLFPILGLGWVLKGIENEISVNEFRAKVRKHATRIHSVAWVLENAFMRCFSAFGGVPKRQLALGLHRQNNMGTIFDRVLSETDLIGDNYFFHGYMIGRYSKKNCPRYLKEENFDTLKKNLNDGKVTLFHGTLIDYLNKSDEVFTVASLLDHMDWMSPESINHELSILIKKMTTNGRIFWRSFSEDIHTLPLNWLCPKRVNDDGDRVPMYFSTWIANIKDTEFCIVERNIPEKISNNWLLMTALNLAKDAVSKTILPSNSSTKPAIQASTHPSNTNLMTYLPIKKCGQMVWVHLGDVINLEYFSKDVLLNCFASIYIVDDSKDRLEYSQYRCKKLDIESIVHFVLSDFCTDELPIKNKINLVDIVTVSYHLSSVRDSRKLLDNCLKCLKPKGKGILAVSDFSTKNISNNQFSRWGNKICQRFLQKNGFDPLDRSDIRLLSSSTETLLEEHSSDTKFFGPDHLVFLSQTR